MWHLIEDFFDQNLVMKGLPWLGLVVDSDHVLQSRSAGYGLGAMVSCPAAPGNSTQKEALE
jgi:hypothetical protein